MCTHASGSDGTASPLWRGQAVCAAINADGEAVLVARTEGGIVAHRFDADGAPLSDLVLPRAPKSVHLLVGGRIAVLMRAPLQGPDAADNQIILFDASGARSDLPGLHYDLVSNPLGTAFLTKTMVDGRTRICLFDAAGALLQTFEPAHQNQAEMPDERYLAFSRNGEAVLLSPVEFFGSGPIEVHARAGAPPLVMQVDARIPVVAAEALDTETVATITGDGALCLTRRGHVVFTHHPSDRPYYSLQVSVDGSLLLAGKGIGADVVDQTGRLVRRIDPSDRVAYWAKALKLHEVPAFRDADAQAQTAFMTALKPSFTAQDLVLTHAGTGLAFVLDDADRATARLTGFSGTSLTHGDDAGWRLQQHDGAVYRAHLKD